MASPYEILKLDNIRLRSMIDYAMDAPNYDSCKSILVDALDGINGAVNSDEIKGERDSLRARNALLEKVAEYAEHKPYCTHNSMMIADAHCSCGLDAAKEGK